MYNFIYPSDFFNPKAVDEQFLEESLWLKEMGHKVITQNHKNISFGGEICIFRGWMMSDKEYQEAVNFVLSHNGTLLSSKEDYFHAHYLPNWYDELKEFTPKTVIHENGIQESLELTAFRTGWTQFFVKDYVKSLTASRGSIAMGFSELMEIINELDAYRGIEGGVCLRQVHNFIASSELRYFCLNGKVFSPSDKPISELALKVAQKITLPFISIDIIEDENGKEWLVEIGDGQVSEFKKPWSKDYFQKMFNVK